MNLETKIKEIILDILDVEEQQVVPTATFVGNLGATSIDLVEILTAFQNSFDVDIDGDQASKIKTVQDAVDLLKVVMAQKG